MINLSEYNEACSEFSISISEQVYFDLTVFKVYSAKNVCGFRDLNNQASCGTKMKTVK